MRVVCRERKEKDLRYQDRDASNQEIRYRKETDWEAEPDKLFFLLRYHESIIIMEKNAGSSQVRDREEGNTVQEQH